MSHTQKFFAIVILSLAFSGSILYAYNDITEEKESSSVLRECGINPVNGEWINAR